MVTDLANAAAVYKDLSPECKSRLEDLFAGIESKEGLAGATPG